MSSSRNRQQLTAAANNRAPARREHGALAGAVQGAQETCQRGGGGQLTRRDRPESRRDSAPFRSRSSGVALFRPVSPAERAPVDTSSAERDRGKRSFSSCS